MNPILSYSVREMSVDLLVLEEFYSSEEFQKWFLQHTYEDSEGIGKLLRLEHSSIELEREADILLSFEGQNGDLRVLIENKINAQFQPNQAKDYKARALGYVDRGECAECVTVLLAPKSYVLMAKRNHLFDFYLSYEDMIGFFQSQKQLGNRADYKIDILEKAIAKSKGVKGKFQSSEGDPAITRFWLEFWNDINKSAPQLVLEKPGVKPSASTFIYLRNHLPKGVNLVYKFVHGFVDIQAGGKGEIIERIGKLYHPFLISPITIERSGKSALFRIQVPKVDPRLSYEENETAVKEAQRSLIFLLNWFNEHLTLWDQL